MSEEIIIGNPDSPYYENKEVREKIDDALHRCQILHQKEGTRQLIDESGKLIDDRGSEAARLWVIEQENRILGEVYDLDPDFVEPLMYSEDSFDK